MVEIKTTLTSDRALEPGVKLRIVERDDNGAMVGYWEGHYSDEKSSIKLYPRSNQYCWWKVPRVVHTIDARLVRVESNSKFGIRNSKSHSATESRGASSVTTRKMPLEGQERMEF